MTMRAYHENRTHGTSGFHLQVYSHHMNSSFSFVPQHWHEELEWIYIESGKLCFTIHGTPFTAGPGDFCFINSGELHEIKAAGDSLHHAVVFNPGFLDFALYDVCQHSFIGPVTSGKLLFPSFSSLLAPEARGTMVAHMKKLIKLYHEPSGCALLSIKLHILHIIELLFQAGCFSENTMSPKGQDSLDRLKQVVGYIRDNLAEPISLQTLAEICFMSPGYFCRYFKRETGKTPVAFINECRIEKACQLLAGSELPVSVISLSVGFDNLSYFIRKFREHKGMTPGKYRRQRRDREGRGF